ncbi:hypothetical protein RM844_17850 [Streptomyces sp. DSM 44915]|uniref:DUF2771 domain-containing protein n=1 Tax=Streptomyces chisholmiae TaxID=3075540 RepID=A0ABU2JTT4_9ACTN|nr:hypothetical protein [Streptomyces sp. DSM 44915]MDT0268149.1 hypothetical protein [Streptomyces sp. DSM 44915]
MTAIARNRGRRAIRTTLAIGTVSLGVLVLSACEKPSPNAHFTLDSSSKSRETASDCYGHGEPLGAERARDCLVGTENRVTFTSTPGDTFRIGVDAHVAEEGWLLFVNEQLYRAEPFTGTYRSFPSDQLFQMVQQQATPGSPPVAEELRLSVAQIRADDYDIETIWASQTQEEYDERLLGSLEGVWNATLEPGD